MATGDDDDGGWGINEGENIPNKVKNPQQNELRSLQEERNPVQTSGDREQNDPDEQEHDLFIPIFALVSLAGLFGAYGYEMLRLASRGELYLPWRTM